MACTIKFKDGTEMPEAEFYAWAMDNIDLKEFAKTGNVVFINKKEQAAQFSAIKKLAYNLQKGFQALFGNKVEIITDTEEIDRILAGDQKGIKKEKVAWHGTPHKVGKFSTEFIGTGEGNQAFGWGLYFTDLEDIARHYANRLASYTFTIPTEYKDLILRRVKGIDNILAVSQDDYVGANLQLQSGIINSVIDLENLIKKAEEQNLTNSSLYKRAIDDLKVLKVLKKLSVVDDYFFIRKSKKLYKVTLHKGKTPDQYTWLEWDKPMSDEQIKKIEKQAESENIKIENLKRAKASNVTRVNSDGSGKFVYRYLSEVLGSQKEASLFLLRAGIDGVKYPAESIVTGATSDTARGFNYVVFDENAITIEEEIQFMRDPKGKVLGFVYEGKIYIDPRTASPTTPIHEFGHIWNQYMKENHKAFYNRGIKLIKEEGGAYIEKVKKLYPELAEKGREEDLYEEALAQAIGDKGALLAKQDQPSFLSWLKDMWKLVKDGLKLSVSAEALSKMTLNDYTNLVAGSMLKGSEIATLLKVERTSQASTNPKFVKNAVKNLIAVKEKVTVSLSELMGKLYKAESKGYANAVRTMKAREAAKKELQAAAEKFLKERGIPITAEMKIEIAKIKDELSYANTMMKLIDMDNAAIRLIQIGRIKKLIKAVKKLRKSKELTSTDKIFIKELDLPSVYEISDLDGYEKLLGKLKSSLSGNVALGIKNEFETFIANEADYINAYKESIAEIKKMIQTKDWEEEYKYLSENGLLEGTNIKSEGEWISFKEKLMDSELEETEKTAQEAKLAKIEENAKKKAKLLEDLKSNIKELMSGNEAELKEAFQEFDGTPTPISYSDIFKNIDNLSYSQLVKLGNVLNNILSDNDFNGIGAFASLGRLNSSFQDIKRAALKAIEDKANKLLPLAEKIAESQTISQMIAEITRGGASIEKLKNFIMGNFETMISKVQSQYNKSFKEFRDLSTSLFGKKAFEHWTRIDTYAFINQWVKNDTIEEKNRTLINRVKNRADQHIAFLKSFNPYNKNPNAILDKKQAISGLKALQDFGVIKNLDLDNLTYELADNITTETLAGKLDKKEQEMYDFLLNKFRDLPNYRNAMSVNYDTEYDDIENYFPTFPEKTYQTEDAKIEDLEKSFVRFSKDNGRAKGRTKNLASSYKVGLIENFSKGYWDALMIDMGSSELLDMSNMLNSTKFGLDRLKEYGLDEDSIKILKNAIGEKVIAEKGGGMVYGNADKALRMETKRLISNISAGLLLKSSNQVFKQPIPAMLVNFSLKPEAATLATRMLSNADFNNAVSNLIDSSTIKYRLNVYEINPSDLGFPIEYFDALVGDAFSKFQGKRFAAIKGTESLQKILSDPTYSLVRLMTKSSYDSFLEASDAYISKINILTAYIDHQKAAGKSFEDIIKDLNENKVNQSALKYAEKWQADLNSESKRVNMSKRLKEKSMLYYMKGFSLTTHQSFVQAIRKLRDKELRKDMDDSEVEAWKATRNAFIMQQIMFRLISTAVSNWTISSLIQAITKNKPDDDDEELVKVGIAFGASMVSDILLGSTSAIGGALWAGAVNALWKVASDKMVEQREQESIADSNRKKLQRPIANAGQIGGAEVALVNMFTRLIFDFSIPSAQAASTLVGGILISALTGSKEIYEATRKVYITLEREANVSTLIDEELNTDLANYSYEISEDDKKILVKELKNTPYNEIKTRLFFNKSSRELCVIPKDSYKKLLKDATFELFGTKSEYLDVIKGTQAFKNLNLMKIQEFTSNAPLYSNEIAYVQANRKGDVIGNQEIKQLIRNQAKKIIERNISEGINPYGLSKYKVKNIR